MTRERNDSRNGFSLVEVMVAMIILSVGLLAMAASTGYIFARVGQANRSTERVVAVQQAVERLRTLPYDSVLTRDSSQAQVSGSYRVWWNVNGMGTSLKTVRVVSSGPSYIAGKGWVPSARDSLTVLIYK